MPLLDNAFALIVGIADYQHVTSLPPTVRNDAQDIHDLLIDPLSCGYQSSNVQLLLDEQSTKMALKTELATLAQRCTSDSTVFVYISSHGGRIETGAYAGEYLLSVDTVYTSAESIAQTAISAAEFLAALRAIPARKLVVVFDCCHAASIGQPTNATSPTFTAGLPNSYYERLAAGRGRVILASSRVDEVSWILPGAANNLFTHHLLAGLRGGAPGPSGVIRIFDLFGYLQPRVTADQPNQHPIFKAELEENFPIALYQGGKAPLYPTFVPADEFAYDVFLSYRHQEPDKTWVRNTLRSHLESEGLRVCIDHRDFRLGRPLVQEMERAVEQSRYTLAVLSPRYLGSNYTELENVLADNLGLEQSQRRLLAVMREECKPRLGIRARLLLDMTDDNEFEASIARLVYELRQPPTK